MTTLLNRADLLACLKQYKASSIEEFAAVLGYKPIQAPEIADVVLKIDNIYQSQALDNITLTAENTSLPRARFLHVTAHRRFNDDEIITEQPQWYRDAQPYQDNDAALKAPENVHPPVQQPLMAWHRLWPFLKLALGAHTTSHKPDMPRIIQHIANGECLRRLPKAKRKGWASQAQIVIDYDPSLVPFWADFNGVQTQLADLRGLAGLSVYAFPDGDPFGACWLNTGDGWRTARYQLPQADVPVLILSDLGCNETGDQRRLRWRRFGEQLARTGARATALMPSPPRWWDGELSQLFMPVYWDRAVRPPLRLTRTTRYSPNSKTERQHPQAERLLSLLATAVRIEPALLRAARYLFPAQAMDVGAEYAVWNHPAMQATLLACYFQPEQAAVYRNCLRDDPALTAPKQHIADLLLQHHAHLSPTIAYEEQLALAELLGFFESTTAQRFAQRLAKTIGEQTGEIKQLGTQWLGRLLTRQQSHDALLTNEYLAAALVAAYQQDGLANLPEVIDLKKFAWLLDANPAIDSPVYQCGAQLLIGWTATGSRIGSLRHSTDILRIETGDGQTTLQKSIGQPPLPLNREQSVLIRSDREELVLDWLTLPNWADSIGQDRYGLYADLNLNGIVQRFRWLAPGVFMMGSPESEPERWQDETQHEVTLTQGYWLADTACTQALWQAVMGKNPSRFKDDPNNPVEQVSWHDCQKFIERLNAQVKGLDARLPSEAEWEYACRAGTITPFSFGDNITPEQVNYDGNHPYANGAKGLYRQTTVSVKTLPPNPWGLYEMHGNVREWCQDWFDNYKNKAVTDPTGAEQGDDRVVRGGSWDYLGRNCRSADRGRYEPDDRSYTIGFRLALGRQGASSTGQQGGQWPDGQPRGSGGSQAGHGTPGSKAKPKRK